MVFSDINTVSSESSSAHTISSVRLCALKISGYAPEVIMFIHRQGTTCSDWTLMIRDVIPQPQRAANKNIILESSVQQHWRAIIESFLLYLRSLLLYSLRCLCRVLLHTSTSCPAEAAPRRYQLTQPQQPQHCQKRSHGPQPSPTVYHSQRLSSSILTIHYGRSG